MTDPVITSVEGNVLLVTLNRPDAMNSIDSALSRELRIVLNELDEDPQLQAGILTGAGRCFSAGVDLKALAAEGVPDGFLDVVADGARKPLIAAVEGFALAGGLELALACDLVVATADAKLGIPEVGVGLFAAAGGLLRLPNRLPRSVATEMALTGQSISGQRAYELGLVARTCERGEAVAVALELARAIVVNAPLAVQATKAVLRAAEVHDERAFWSLQAETRERLFATQDAIEGIRAFSERREPHWTGA